jgi:hypothetical protein
MKLKPIVVLVVTGKNTYALGSYSTAEEAEEAKKDVQKQLSINMEGDVAKALRIIILNREQETGVYTQGKPVILRHVEWT